MDSLSDAKRKLRQELVSMRRMWTTEDIKVGSERIAQHLYHWTLYQKAKIVMFFLSMPDEPQMEKLILDAWAQGKVVCVPHMQEKLGFMDAAVIKNMSDLISGRFGLQVPNPAFLKLVDPGTIDLVIVPGVAFDISGNRLGMGGGYYDRFLPKAILATHVGVSWQSHILLTLPSAKHDRSMQYLVTETGIVSCSKGKM